MKFSEQLKFVRFKQKLTQRQLAQILEISPGAVYKYENELMSPGYKIIQKFEFYLTENISELSMPLMDDISEDSEYKEGETMSTSQQSMLIEYQKNEIEQLKQKINKHECVYDGIQSDIRFSFKVKFNWSLKNPGIKVKYLSQDSSYIPSMAKKLGYSEAEIIEILQIDEMVEYKNHNIHKLRTEKQKDDMLSIMNDFIKVYRGIKIHTTMLVAEIPVLYTHKNGTVYKANVEYRINWVKGTGTAHIRWLKD